MKAWEGAEEGCDYHLHSTSKNTSTKLNMAVS